MQDFIKYLESNNHAKSTQKAYLRYVNKFLEWHDNRSNNDLANCTKKDIIKYLEYLKNRKQQQNITRRNSLIALNHYFVFLVNNEIVTANPTALLKIRGVKKTSLYNIYSTEELNSLYDDYYHNFIRNYNDSCYPSRLGGIPQNQRQQSFLSRQRNYVMLGMLVYQGLHTNELQRISLNDVNLNKATVYIPGRVKSNERNIPLNASQIGSLINYIQNIRQQFFEFCTETEQLFFALPEAGRKQTDSTDLMGVVKSLSKQVKSINSKFLNFKQVRASVITGWLKTEGLRRAQYLAGHRYISTTERYLPNDLEDLTGDITKFNPF